MEKRVAGDESVEKLHGSGPLVGRTVLITRARDQSDQMASSLERLGARVVHCPVIEIKEPSSWEAMDSALEQIGSYNWIVFTSSNGAAFFFRRLSEKRKDWIALLSQMVVCAIGPATARAVEEAGARPDVIARDSRGEGAVEAIIEHLGGRDRVCGLRFLIPRARVARDVLPDRLSELGAHVDAVEAYQTMKPDVDGESIKRLFTDKQVDAITFTSSSTVTNFAAAVGETDLSRLLNSTIIACIGPITAATAAEYGLREIIQPRVYNSEALVEALTLALSRGD
jgi:uroporphyrinogen III methyltransferase / synthase